MDIYKIVLFFRYAKSPYRVYIHIIIWIYTKQYCFSLKVSYHYMEIYKKIVSDLKKSSIGWINTKYCF